MNTDNPPPTLAPTLTDRKRPRKAAPKPEKPWPDFPLYWHPRGYWMCRRHGRPWIYEADAIASYSRYVKDMDALQAGAPRPSNIPKRYFLRDAINLYLTRQKRRHEEGKISDEQFARDRKELQTELPKVVKVVTPLSAFRATGPDDDGPAKLFHSIKVRAAKRGLNAQLKHMVIVRACLNHAAEKKLMLSPDYGDDFDPPTPSEIERDRRARDEKTGERSWSVEELRTILAEAKTMQGERRGVRKNRIHPNHHIHAQILLALFGGFGSDDLSVLRESQLNRKLGTVLHYRAKNGKPCVCALPRIVWEAIDHSIAQRAEPAGDDAKGPTLPTRGGRRCNAAQNQVDEMGVKRAGRNDTIGKNFQRFAKRIKLHRQRAGFKTLRAMCRTMMVGAGVDEDIRAAIMGRKLRYAADEYYLRGDLRAELFKAAAHIERQLFPRAKRTPRRQAGGSTAAKRAKS